ncbi:redoxin domain-containing protein [Anaerolineae bacterium CFX7]|nr:redoxin domain-containing protein [Anaerolineae bacterium CFX7]
MGQISDVLASLEKKPRRAPIWIFGGMFAAVAIVLALLAWAVQTKSAPPLASGVAPNFTLRTFDGQSITLSELRGKPVVINFWASWCIPCRTEAPILERAWKDYRERGVVILGVDYVDTEDAAKKFIQEYGMTYLNGPDLGTRISQMYRITGVPETYFVTREGKMLSGIDSNGRAYANWIGPIDDDSLRERIEKLLSE